MSFFGRLVGLGLTVGATLAAVKVAEKYQANQAASENPGEKRNAEMVFNDISKAAAEVYNETAVKAKDFAANVKEKAPEYVDKVKKEFCGEKETIEIKDSEVKDEE
ncbi:MAG: hypothetical protein GX683_07010 [Ruminococcaceae bacterium]|nr:hypothetical protein [Oscillospiraceae bacterium]